VGLEDFLQVTPVAFEVLHRETLVVDAMPLKQLIRLKAVQAQRLGELRMGDESTSEGFDEERLLGESIEVGVCGAQPSSNVLRNFEVYVH
jgi:hypothetical protein